MSGTLAEKLRDLLTGLGPGETEHYKLLLSMAAGSLIGRVDSFGDTSAVQRAALSVTLRSISAIHPPHILWRGRPEWMTNGLIHALQDEASAYAGRASRNDFGWMHVGGDVANSVAFSPELRGLFDNASEYAPSGAMYVFYLHPGDRVEPHVDEVGNSVAAVVMIEHCHERVTPSNLVLYYPDGGRERISMVPGEMIIFDAATLVHAREPVGENERVCVLTIGFHAKNSPVKTAS